MPLFQIQTTKAYCGRGRHYWSCHDQLPCHPAVLDTIRAAGFHIGETGVLSLLDGEWREVVNAVDAKARESFTVLASDKYTAVVELARQVRV